MYSDHGSRAEDSFYIVRQPVPASSSLRYFEAGAAQNHCFPSALNQLFGVQGSELKLVPDHLWVEFCVRSEAFYQGAGSALIRALDLAVKGTGDHTLTLI